MATNSTVVCEVSKELKDALKAFRFRKEKSIAAKFMKINREKLIVNLDEEFEDTTIEELREELPHQQPRYIALSYIINHSDGRVSYPEVFIFMTPQGSEPSLQMMYAGSKNTVVQECEFTKVIELRNAEDFTDEVITSHLKKR